MRKSLFILIAAVILFGMNCSGDSEDEKRIVPEVVCQSETLIGVDDIFMNEGLNKPATVKINPVTDELVVMDYGNTCLYFFSKDGEFIRKAGRKGQGPGDLSGAFNLYIDRDGDIYVYEAFNQRISIFSKEGKFITFFRTPELIGHARLFVTEEKEIVMNSPFGGYYLTVFNRDGEIVREIGEITRYNYETKFHVDESYATGIPVLDLNGNYWLFLYLWPKVIKFDPALNLISEKMIDKELELESYFDPMHLKDPLTHSLELYHDVIQNDGRFYLLRYRFDPDPDNPKDLNMYILDINLNSVKKMILPITRSMWFSPLAYLRMQFDLIGDSKDILMPHINNSELLRFSAQEKH